MFTIAFCLGVLLSGCLTSSAERSRILGVFPFAPYSHYALGSSLMKALAEKGHDVTIITAHREKNPPKNYREVYVDGVVAQMEGKITFLDYLELFIKCQNTRGILNKLNYF